MPGRDLSGTCVVVLCVGGLSGQYLWCCVQDPVSHM